VFEREGIYRLHVHAVATNPSSGQSLRTAAHTYVFQVGDVPLGDAFCGLSSAGAGDAEAVARAVDDAAAQAVAAAQAAAAAEAVPSDEREGTGRDAQDDEGAAVAASGGTPFGPVQIALVAGGVLMVGGVIGITVWYLRRLRADAAVLVGDTPAAHTAAPTGRAASAAGATEA
jgi:hypothetical protein